MEKQNVPVSTPVSKKNNKTNTKKISNKTSNKKLDCIPLDFSEDIDKDKMDLLNALLKINENLDASNDTKIAVNIAVGLFKLIVEEQTRIRNRQKIINECLKNYNDILKDYDNQSIKMQKLKELAQLTGLNESKKSKEKDEVLLNFLVNRLKK